MALTITTIPCLSDNYAFLIGDGTRTALVDVPEAEPILEALDRNSWSLDEVWLTHHHSDHVDGLDKVRERFPDLRVTGARSDRDRLPNLDRDVADGEQFDFAGNEVRVLDVPGHTVGHIAFYIPDSGAAFTADTLMAFGCGRVFEGSMAQMWKSLCRLRALPEDTLIYSGHEYTEKNANFALTIEPDNLALRKRAEDIAERRARGEATVPSTLREEIATNPFLRADLESVKEAISMQRSDDVEVFAEIRSRRDDF
ncbi:hydroxyacylglutathione hydrolase [Palleronia sp. LCG004]|uniref:hydroxyacylglutathione hydrolase n=1 Tax=Palleronia sp. LCG004 TaxID=3079304 RepID=UPI0029428D4A|nr:hydroxyacylglutathione hydrolase [Palleronia sp. LCG004]WOI55078.1 hydroxyacylglutathione hydrolase [Palleronia sp. LCG004]